VKSKTILAILLLVMMTLSCSKNETDWKGTIKKEDGVTVIENTGVGLWGKQAIEKIRFKENLSLGVEEGTEEYMFYGPLQMAVDEELNIYVLDIRNFKLMKYDKDGKFVWKTGRHGQGPEEFQALRNLKISPSGEIVVLDNRSLLKFYNKAGVYLRVINLQNSFFDFNFLPNGQILIDNIIEGQLGVEPDLYSEEGKFLKAFPINYRYGPNLPNLIGASDKAIRCLGDEIYFSVPDDYEIRVFNLEGRILKKIRRNVSLTPIKLFKEKGVLQRMTIRDISGPCFKYKNDILVNSLSVYEEGKGRKQLVDFFNEGGKYLGSTELAKNIYLSSVDAEDNFYFIQRLPFPRISRCMLIIE